MGPGITPGYFANPEANAQLFRDDGWMYLGDIIEIDADGYIRVVGRTADFIIRGGHNVSAPAVEEEILSHWRVAMAAVVGMPDPVLGEKMCACVILRRGGALTLPELVAFLEAREIARFKLPERLEIMADFPVSTFGKVSKKTLVEAVAKRVGQERAQRP